MDDGAEEKKKKVALKKEGLPLCPRSVLLHFRRIPARWTARCLAKGNS